MNDVINQNSQHRAGWQTGSPPETGLYWVRTRRGFGGSEVGYHSAYWNSAYWRFRDGKDAATGRQVTHFQVIEEPQALGCNEIYEDALDRLGCAAQVEKGVMLTSELGKGV